MLAILLGPLGIGNALLRRDLANPGAVRGFREVDGDAEFAGGNGEAVDVVLVLVGDEDCVEGAGVFASKFHAAEELAAAQAGIDQNARGSLGAVRTAGDDAAVSLGTGGEYGETHHSMSIVLFDVEERVGIGADSSFSNVASIAIKTTA